MGEKKNARRLLQKFEHEIVAINKRNIREITGEISEADILLLAESISVSRATYLKQVLAMSTIVEGKPSINISKQLIECRQAYQEAMHGFDALKQALERGYFLINSEEEMMMSKEPGTENQF